MLVIFLVKLQAILRKIFILVSNHSYYECFYGMLMFEYIG